MIEGIDNTAQANADDEDDLDALTHDKEDDAESGQ